jgi:hypothetical protein
MGLVDDHLSLLQRGLSRLFGILPSHFEGCLECLLHMLEMPHLSLKLLELALGSELLVDEILHLTSYGLQEGANLIRIITPHCPTEFLFPNIKR